MSNITITNLPLTTALSSAAQLMIVQNGTAYRATTAQIANLNNNSGTVTSVTALAPLSGGTISQSGSIGLSTNSITNTYLANMNGFSLKGNNTASTAQPLDLTVAQVMTMLAAAPLNSPNFTGSPTAPTPSTSDSSTAIATTAFVKAQPFVNTSTSIIAGTGLSGGGSLSSNVTLSLASIANSTVLANTSGSSAAPTPTTVTSLLDSAFGTTQGTILYRSASAWTTLAPGTSGLFLKTNGTNADVSWAAPAGSGTITQINTGTGLTGGPITTTGTISLANTAVIPGTYGSSSATPTFTVNAQGQITSATNTNISVNASSITTGVLGPTVGGTGLTSYNIGDMIYANATNQLTKLPAGQNGYILVMSGGVPIWSVAASSGVATFSAGTTGLTPTGTNTGNVTLGGTLATTNGGTGLTTFTAANNAIYSSSSSALVAGTLPVAAGGTGSITFTANSVLYGNGTSAIASTAAGITGQVLLATTGSAPSWGQVSLTSNVTGILPPANGGTGVNNGTSTLTLGGNLTTSGAFATTLTVTGATNVTLPTTGTLVNTAVTTLSSLASVGTITTGTWNATAIGPTYGGTGQTSYATGDILYASATNTLSKLTAGTNGYVLTLSGGVPTWASVPAVTSFSAGTTGFTPNTATTGAVTLAGTLNAASGGTGQTSYTIGDILYASGTTALSKLADVATGSVLVSGGVGVAPSYSATPTLTSLTAPTVIGGTAASSTLTLESTSGVGTSDSIIFKTGSQLTRMTISTAGLVTANNFASSNVAITGGAIDGTAIGATTTSTGAFSSLSATNLSLTNPLGATYGGTGQSAVATGDILYGSATNTWSRLSAGTNGYVLTLAGGVPTWAASSTGVSTVSGGTTGLTPSSPSTGAIVLGGTLISANGGTGFSTYAAGDLIYASATNTLSKLTAGSSGYVLTISGGVPTWAPAAGTSSLTIGTTAISGGTNGYILYNNSGVLGNLSAVPIANGGTGQTTASAAFNALSPITTTGDLIIGNGTNSATRLAIGTNGYVLTSNGTTATWAASTGGVTSFSAGTTGFTPSSTTTGAITLAGTLNVANGGTGVTTSSGANSLVLRDSGSNITANSFYAGFTSVAASGTTITLTVSSTPNYVITGSGGQVIQLPNATTLPNGATFSFNNNQSSGTITINNNSSTLIVSIPSGGYIEVILLSNSSAAGTWDTHTQAPSNVSWSTNTLSYPGSITSSTWNGTAIGATYGGTGQSAVTTGDLLYGSATNTWSRLASVAVGNVLLSGGVATAPSWTTSPANGTLLIGNGTGFSAATLTAGSNITITNGAGSITIASTGGGSSNVPTGGGTDAIFWNNGQTITTSYSIPASTNAGTFGPVTIQSAATITIPSSSTWTVI